MLNLNLAVVDAHKMLDENRELKQIRKLGHRIDFIQRNQITDKTSDNAGKMADNNEQLNKTLITAELTIEKFGQTAETK